MIPNFRNDVEAARYAEINEPYRTALARPNGPEYAARYGMPAAVAAERCRKAAITGDQRTFRLQCMALSLLTNDGRKAA